MGVTRASRQQLMDAGFERVYVQLDWWDGPREGLADVHGVPHYFSSTIAESDDENEDQFRVWPVSPQLLALEREQWAIQAEWIKLTQAGSAQPDSNPRRGGVDTRYDELTTLLAPRREVPEHARRLAAELQFCDGYRYQADGPNYLFRWR
jgi:hypothetical protein